MPRIGSLFSGYGGLELGVAAALGGTVAWHSEIDRGASAVLAHHWPDVPNLGDVSAVDWTDVEPVDVLTGGFPCQDISHAGARRGLVRDGDGRTRSGLWGEMLRAIVETEPRLVVIENVRGLLSATADSDVEPCPFCMGDGTASPMRALGAVLADLANAGFDAEWCGLRAADVGAAHNRYRIFIVAWPRDSPANTGGEPVRLRPGLCESEQGRLRRGRPHDSPVPAHESPTALELLPTPRAGDGTKGGPNQRGSSGDLMLPSAVVRLLPTPAVNDMGAGKTVEWWDEWAPAQKAADGRPATHGASLHIEALRLLPTPAASESGGERDLDLRMAGASQVELSDVVRIEQEWGDYADAIRRWESVLGRPAPAPTEPTGRGDANRLSPSFVEWLMGLDAGHVTDADLTRNAQLKALGNGVVPLQAAEAVRHLLASTDHERTTA